MVDGHRVTGELSPCDSDKWLNDFLNVFGRPEPIYEKIA